MLLILKTHAFFYTIVVNRSFIAQNTSSTQIITKNLITIKF